jgi:tRNA(Arg) A34 adenosine deaminase TadA
MRVPSRPVSGVDRRQLIAGAAVAFAVPSIPRAYARATQAPATEEDTRLMRLAIEEAARGDYPFGAVITRDGEVLARGHNLGIKEQNPTAHGEMVAIRNFLAAHGPDNLKGTTLYTSGEPCAMCMGAIVWCGIARLVYAASMEQLATKIDQIMVPSAEVADKSSFVEIAITGGVLADEAMKLFR